MSRARLAAVAALALGLAAMAGLTALIATDPLRGVSGAALLTSAVAAAWQGLRRRGGARGFALVASALMLAGVVALLVTRQPLLVLGAVAALGLSMTASAYAFRSRVRVDDTVVRGRRARARSRRCRRRGVDARSAAALP
jgi:hypothetical protein